VVYVQPIPSVKLTVGGDGGFGVSSTRALRGYWARGPLAILANFMGHTMAVATSKLMLDRTAFEAPHR